MESGNRVSFKCMMIVAGMGLFVLGALSSAYAQEEKSTWMIRVRALGVLPDDSSDAISIIGGEAEVDDSMTADLDISYFFTDNIAAELTLAVTKHDVKASNTAVGDADLGDVWLLPPALTLQYHIMPDARFRPYVGAGVNYTVFFSEDEGPVADDIDYDDEFGFVLQVGFDWGLTEHWAINVDVKKVWLSTDVEVDAQTALGAGAIVNTEVDIDPWLIGVGLGYRF